MQIRIVLRYSPPRFGNPYGLPSKFVTQKRGGASMSPKRKAGSNKAKAKSKRKSFRRIATEEAFSIPEQMDAQRELLAKTQEYDPDLFLWQFQTDRAGPMHNKLLDLFDERL